MAVEPRFPAGSSPVAELGGGSAAAASGYMEGGWRARSELAADEDDGITLDEAIRGGRGALEG